MGPDLDQQDANLWSPSQSLDAFTARPRRDPDNHGELDTPYGGSSTDVERAHSPQTASAIREASLRYLSGPHLSKLATGFLSPISILRSSLGQVSASPGGRAAMLALALEFDVDHEDPLLNDVCRIEALTSIPAITWKTRLTVAHAAILTLFSFTWCTRESFLEIACRWNHLALIIWTDLREDEGEQQFLDQSTRRQ